MGRAAIDTLAVRTPLAEGLPGIYREGEFVDQMLGGFDDTLAPAHTTLDCLDAYFDTATAPQDFLGVLADWLVGDAIPVLPTESLRKLFPTLEFVGTRAGIADAIRLLTGETVDVTDSGGVYIARNGDPPTATTASVTIQGATSNRSVEAVIRNLVPAHVAVARS